MSNYTAVSRSGHGLVSVRHLAESGSDRDSVALRGIAAILVDGRERYEVYYRTPAWEASMEWARFHGIEPNRIPAGSVVERDAANRCIRYESFVSTGPATCDILIRDGEPVTVECVEQGEGVLPFPKEVTG